jgi:hypothetical protein
LPPQGHRALENPLHFQLRDLTAQPHQLRPLVLIQRRVPALAPLPVLRHPLAQGSLFTPGSRATCAIGLPVSRTIRTAPSLKSRSNFLCVSRTGELIFRAMVASS